MPPEHAESAAEWYAGGLRFSCLPGCRRCCGGAPGNVWVTEDERAALAAFLGLTREDFERACVRCLAGACVSLRERPNGDCVLLGERGCTTYAVRPRQCRDYPFWPELVASPEAWAAEARRCPGLNQGTLHDAAEINAVLRAQAART